MIREHDDIARVIGHRLRAHQAALATAAALGFPAILAAQVSATRAALAEDVAILEELARLGGDV